MTTESERNERQRDLVSVCCGAGLSIGGVGVTHYHVCGKCDRACDTRPWDGGDVKREPTMSDAEWAKRTETQERDRATAIKWYESEDGDVNALVRDLATARAEGYQQGYENGVIDRRVADYDEGRAEGIEQGARAQRERDIGLVQAELDKLHSRWSLDSAYLNQAIAAIRASGRET